VTGSVVVTPADGGHGGIFTPSTVTLTGAASQTATYTPLQLTVSAVSATNGGGLTNPSPAAFSPPASLTPGYPGMTTGWTNGSNTTLTNGLSGDPFSGLNSSSCVEDGTTNYHQCTTTVFTVVGGSTHHVAAMVKQGSGTRNADIAYEDNAGAASAVVIVNPSTGAILGTTGTFGGATVANQTSFSLGSGWWLVEFDGTLPSGVTSAVAAVFLDNGAAGPSPYLGNGTSGALLTRITVE
jgi:hypothetical protein